MKTLTGSILILSLFIIGCDSYEEVKVLYPNGKISEQYLANSKGIKNGAYLKYNKDGQIEVELHYKIGKRDSISRLYFSNGKIKEEGFYVNDKLEGVVKEYYEKGGVRNEFTYKNGVKSGANKVFNPKGELVGEYTYENDKKNGPFTQIGQYNFKLVGTYKNDKREGSYTEYFDNGRIYKEGRFKDGKENGKQISYFRNGRKSSVGNMINGKRSGMWKIYSEYTGQIRQIRNYIDGQPY